MARYAVESRRQAMVATGVVTAVKEWEDGGDGKRRKSDEQARHEDTGMPLWEVSVVYTTVMFGDEVSVAHKVAVGHEVEPKIQDYTPITFHGLVVDANMNRHKTFTERWSAEALDEFVAKGSDAKTGTRAAAAPSKEKAA